MARSVSAVEVNKFNAGLITDASPLTTPDNSSLEEDNMVLNIDGSRSRRLGMDYESDYDIITTTIEDAGDTKVGISSYRWDNAGGDPEKSVEVVQVGNELKFFDLNASSVSKGLFHTELLITAPTDFIFSFTVVDGILVVSTGEKEIYSLEYTAPDGITVTTSRLLVRDFFGIADVFDGVDITRGSDVQNRPITLDDAHLYNLRNQSWGIPRVSGNTEDMGDPVLYFFEQSTGLYPANSDTITEALYPDAGDSDNRTVERFFAANLVSNPLGTTRAAQGYFIIDALDRGSSRNTEEAANRARYSELTSLPVDTLPSDETPGGASTITEFAGRVFYSGFPGDVIDGDRHSPKMSSYVLFSKVVDSTADLNLCYQEGDPTSKNNPDIVDTDGGFIRINEAYGIKRLINLGSALIVVAANGVWRIVGGTDKGFTATNYIVEKISDRGCTAKDSIAVIDNTFMYWGDDAIYHVAPDQFGGLVANNITFGRIQKLYDSINIEDKRAAKGEYDGYERKVRWLYYNRTADDEPTKELVLDLQLQAYYTNTIKQLDGEVFPRAATIFVALPYQVVGSEVNLVAGLDDVVVGTDPVVLTVNTKEGIAQREIGYVVVTSVSPVVEYTFAIYRNTDFKDWFSVDGVGVDADAHVVTSYLSGTDFQREKQVPYITIHSKRTESGYQEDGDDLIPVGRSSILVQARWDWSNSTSSGKWGREFQAYRYRRLYIPTGSDDDFDNGFETVVTKNKLRGSGKVLSLKFRSEPERDFHLYGWSMLFDMSQNV